MDELVDWAVLILCIILFFRLHATTIVRFYRDSCGACQNSAKEWRSFKMRHILNPLVKVVEIDTDTDYGRELMEAYGLQYVPSILRIRGLEIVKYEGDRSASDLCDFVMG